ncbi:MAG: hypothetical protein Q7R76_00770 [Candidatus Woesearchaeota archaeon]|nr:hypothetical protein [Candidatus Woesearchaeota archaeon]
MAKKTLVVNMISEYTFDDERGTPGAYSEVYPDAQDANRKRVALKLVGERKTYLRTEFLDAGNKNMQIQHPHFLTPEVVGQGTIDEKNVAYWVMKPGDMTLEAFLDERIPPEAGEQKIQERVSDTEWVKDTYYFLLNALQVVRKIEESGVIEPWNMDVKERNIIIMDKSKGLRSFMIADPVPLEETTTHAGDFARAKRGKSNIGFDAVMKSAYRMMTGYYYPVLSDKIPDHVKDLNTNVSPDVLAVMNSYFRSAKQVNATTIDECVGKLVDAIEKTTSSRYAKDIPYFKVEKTEKDGCTVYQVFEPVAYFDHKVEGITKGDYAGDPVTAQERILRQKQEITEVQTELSRKDRLLPDQKREIEEKGQRALLRLTESYTTQIKGRIEELRDEAKRRSEAAQAEYTALEQACAREV